MTDIEQDSNQKAQALLAEIEALKAAAQNAKDEAETASSKAMEVIDALHRTFTSFPPNIVQRSGHEVTIKDKVQVESGRNIAGSAAVVVAAAALVIAWYQLNRIQNDAKIQFEYQVLGNIKEATTDFLNDASAARTFNAELYPEYPYEVREPLEHLIGTQLLTAVFNEFFVAHELRESTATIVVGEKLISDERWLEITNFVCDSISGKGYEHSLDYLEERASELPKESAVFEYLKGSCNG